MSKNTVSIVVPVYNSKNYLVKCVESLEIQTYSDTEIILVDDGSTDGSEIICDSLCEKYNNIIIIHQKNSGASSARNNGIEHADGKFIMFCDSDDTVSENLIKEMITAQENNPELLAVCGIQKQQDGKNTNYLIDCNQSAKIDKSDFFIIQKNQLFNAPVNKLFNLDIIKNNNIRFREEITLGEDLIFNADYVMAANCDFVVVNKPLYFYNIGVEESLSKKYIADIQKNYVAMKSKFDELINFTKTDMNIYGERYATILLYNIINAIKNTLSDKNTDRSNERINTISDILKSFDVKAIVNKANCAGYNNFYLKLLCLGNPKLIYIFRSLKKQ